METFLYAWLLSEGNSASSDYFLIPYFTDRGYSSELLDTRRPPPAQLPERLPDIIIINRYLPKVWLTLLRRLDEKGVTICYFMDDDLFDLGAHVGLPWRYRWKLWKNHRQKHPILRLVHQIWVSTPYLAEKYADLHPQLIAPQYPVAQLQTTPLVRICYHGTASHQTEIQWLQEVISRVQAHTPHSHFELFGGDRVRDLYRGVPRVSVIQPMSWPDYLAWTQAERRDIALAPLLPGRFNAARGITKFFDYTRMQAAGLYSDVAPYRDYIKGGEDGLLLNNDVTQWVDTIITLCEQPQQRHAIVLAAQRRLGLESGARS